MYIKVDQDKCIGCCQCARVCRKQTFAMKDGKCMVQDDSKCMKCGHCVAICPKGAISLNGITAHDVDIQYQKMSPEQKIVAMRRSVRHFIQEPLTKEQIH